MKMVEIRVYGLVSHPEYENERNCQAFHLPKLKLVFMYVVVHRSVFSSRIGNSAIELIVDLINI